LKNKYHEGSQSQTYKILKDELKTNQFLKMIKKIDQNQFSLNQTLNQLNNEGWTNSINKILK
jgi:hypothetical protein